MTDTASVASVAFRAWPKPPPESAFSGLAGDIVRAIEPASEADPIALLVQTLLAFGNCVGRSPVFLVEADEHRGNLNALLVGATSKARKGTSWGHIRRLFGAVEEPWTQEQIQSGLSSGEGLIWAVRDPITKQEPIREKGRITGYQENQIDPGVEDKRLLVMEAEFASTLRVMGREGNILSAVIREAWDTGHLRAMTKNTPAQATNAHVSILGHITAEELRRELTRTEAANGFLNRFLVVCVRRSKFLPEGGTPDEQVMLKLAGRLQEARAFARQASVVRRDDGARELWADVYPLLSAGQPGLLGAAISRGEAQVIRLSLLYALLDCSVVVREDHLAAALALWAYAADSARFVFGEALGDPIADELFQKIQASPKGLTRTEMHNLFGRHRSGHDLDRALRLLEEQGLVGCQTEQTGGRPTERWTANKAKEANRPPVNSPSSLSSPRGDAWEPAA